MTKEVVRLILSRQISSLPSSFMEDKKSISIVLLAVLAIGLSIFVSLQNLKLRETKNVITEEKASTSNSNLISNTRIVISQLGISFEYPDSFKNSVGDLAVTELIKEDYAQINGYPFFFNDRKDWEGRYVRFGTVWLRGNNGNNSESFSTGGYVYGLGVFEGSEPPCLKFDSTQKMVSRFGVPFTLYTGAHMCNFELEGGNHESAPLSGYIAAAVDISDVTYRGATFNSVSFSMLGLSEKDFLQMLMSIKAE